MSAQPRNAAQRPRPFLWSVRRELWEYRSIFIAPLVTAAVVMLGFLLTLFGLKEQIHHLTAMTPDEQSIELAHDYAKCIFPIIITAVLVGMTYCLGALHNERRDRSILFWKSLPVSDLTAVLSKATVPLLVLPLVVFVIIVAEQLVFLVVDSAALLGSGLSSAPLWTQPPLIPMFAETLYGLLAMTFWQAPIYAWLLLISAWTRRSTFLWAVLPPMAIGLLEAIVLRSGHFVALLWNRTVGWYDAGFASQADGAEAMSRAAPLALLSSPGLWLGLLAAGAFLAAAVRLRRHCQPL
jgi:ABC-2 type transport system permease protein